MACANHWLNRGEHMISSEIRLLPQLGASQTSASSNGRAAIATAAMPDSENQYKRGVGARHFPSSRSSSCHQAPNSHVRSGRRAGPQAIDCCARKARFHARNQFDRPVAIICRMPPPLHFPIFRTILTPSRLGTEGRFAVVTRREAGRRWTLTWLLTSATEADGEIVWSWRPKGPALRRRCVSASWANGGKRQGSPGRARISRNTTAQGRPVVTACTLRFSRFAQISCAKPPGAAATRSSLRPLTSRRVYDQSKARAECAARTRTHVSPTVIPGRSEGPNPEISRFSRCAIAHHSSMLRIAPE